MAKRRIYPEGYKGARYINTAIRRLRKHEDIDLPTMTHTGKQLLPSGALITSGERKGEVRGYKAYRDYFITQIEPYRKGVRVLSEREYTEEITRFVNSFSQRTTERTVLTPVNLFTMEGQDSYFYQRAVYILTETPAISLPKDEVLKMSKEDIRRLFKIANEIKEEWKYESHKGDMTYYEILDMVYNDIVNGDLIEGKDYIRTGKNGRFEYELTADGRDRYSMDDEE